MHKTQITIRTKMTKSSSRGLASLWIANQSGTLRSSSSKKNQPLFQTISSDWMERERGVQQLTTSHPLLKKQRSQTEKSSKRKSRKKSTASPVLRAQSLKTKKNASTNISISPRKIGLSLRINPEAVISTAKNRSIKKKHKKSEWHFLPRPPEHLT